jgi:hypothetical protein
LGRCSQLTYNGIVDLHERVAEDALAVFFRNNHFMVLTRRRGCLFTLATGASRRSSASLGSRRNIMIS